MGGNVGFFIMDTLDGCTFSFALHYPSEIHLTNNNVTAIAFDNCGYARIGTKSAGFGRYTGDTATAFALTQNNSPLPSDKINCIMTNGNEKWIGTIAGLTVLNCDCQYNVVNALTHSSMAIAVFPNPSHQNFSVKLPGQRIFSLALTDYIGKEIYKATSVSGQIEIDASDFTDGIYFLQALNENERLTVKLIKQ
jgi:hypothetical protein